MFGISERLHAVEESNKRMEAKIDFLISKTEKFMSTLSQQLLDLQAAAAADTNAENSAITLLNGLSAQLKAAASTGDLAAVEQIAQQLDTNSAALAAAVVANTPAAPVS